MDSDATRGLYRKYLVERTDGSSGPGGKHEHCEYFVLDLVHDKHALIALEAYAESCELEYPSLYDDLNNILAKLLPSRRCVPSPVRGLKDRECSAPAVIPLGNGCWFCVEHGLEVHRRYSANGFDGGIGPSGIAALVRRGALTISEGGWKGGK